MRGLFVTGTDTEIGKTFVTCLLGFGLQKQGIDICPVKPVASGGIDLDGQPISEDVLQYARFMDISEPLHSLSPFCFERPASPHFAAMLEHTRIEPGTIISSLDELHERNPYLLVEGVGGWLVPITPNYLVADLAGDLDMPIIVVVANRLGAINHTLLTLEAIRTYDEELLGVIVTHPHPEGEADLLQNNIDTIRTIGNVDLLGCIPYLEPERLHENQREQLWDTLQDSIQWKTIIDRLRSR